MAFCMPYKRNIRKQLKNNGAIAVYTWPNAWDIEHKFRIE
jgi:hypothetical protein